MLIAFLQYPLQTLQPCHTPSVCRTRCHLPLFLFLRACQTFLFFSVFSLISTAVLTLRGCDKNDKSSRSPALASLFSPSPARLSDPAQSQGISRRPLLVARLLVAFIMGALLSCCSLSPTKTPQQKPQQDPKHGQQPHEPIPSGPSASSGSSEFKFAHYRSLPSGVEKVSIEHVYDGDTLTINEYNRARVRLRGSDAPELKEREPYAQESADMVKQLCPKRSVAWLQFDSDEREDTYGRLLAYVFTENPDRSVGGYICVNIATIEKGLANYYAPGGSKISKHDEMLGAAQNARKRKLNIWKNFNMNQVVYKTRNGNAFHSKDCEHVQNARLTSLKLGEAMDNGLSPCRTCKPAS